MCSIHKISADNKKVLLCFITDIMQWRHGRSCASCECYVYVNGEYSVMNLGTLKKV
jgi:hypothetical protein